MDQYSMPQEGTTVMLNDRKWKIIQQMADGPFSKVFLVEESGKQYAMKVEKAEGCLRPVLKLDHQVLCNLGSCKGFPSLVSSGRTRGFKYVVMQLLGPDLDVLLDMMPNRCFSKSTQYKIALQTLERLQRLHRAGWLNRDVKIHNFAVGMGADSSTIYMLDFGLTKKFIDKNRPFLLRGCGPCVGTFPFAPLASGAFKDQTPADDLEGWLYMMLHLMKGGLPWYNQKNQWDMPTCREWKMYARTESGKKRLFEGLEPCWKEIFNMIISTPAYTVPNYEKMATMIYNTARQTGVNLSDPFDWQMNQVGRALVGLSPLPTVSTTVHTALRSRLDTVCTAVG